MIIDKLKIQNSKPNHRFDWHRRWIFQIQTTFRSTLRIDCFTGKRAAPPRTLPNSRVTTTATTAPSSITWSGRKRRPAGCCRRAAPNTARWSPCPCCTSKSCRSRTRPTSQHKHFILLIFYSFKFKRTGGSIFISLFIKWIQNKIIHFF